ncbi:hypothetical protein SATMO3_02920 [Sporomusa aerivorans]
MAATSRGLRRLSGTHGQAARFIFPRERDFDRKCRINQIIIKPLLLEEYARGRV